MLRHLDLFSGIGGFALAAQWAGWETIGFSEIDPYASAVLKKHWPDVPNYGDVRTVPAIDCDLITGGFPCQPFSVAGKRKGAGDDRFLWPAMLDVIGRCKPAWVLAENVPGIIGMELERVLADLEGIGYRVAPPLIIPACGVGADHGRKRVWIVAHLDGEWKSQPQRAIGDEWGRPSDCSLENAWPPRDAYDGLLRDIHGIPQRLDRIDALGNAIVPQVAEVILRYMRQIHERNP